MVVILISSPLMTKIETLSISLGIIKYHYDKEQEKKTIKVP